jgi:hypothetical protein
MRGVTTLMFVVLIPALAALGHDLYLFSLDQSRGFMLSTPGYMWTHYHKESYEWAVHNLDPGIWAMIDYLLAQKGLLLGVIFAGAIWLVIGLFKILKLGSSKTHNGSSTQSGKGGGFKYKRR